MRTDLHIHTTASDGCWTPVKLISTINQLNIHLFSVTDHDSVGNVIETANLSLHISAAFITGVEISALLDGRLYHILGYGIDPTDGVLLHKLAENRQKLDSTNDSDIRKLIMVGYNLDYEHYAAYTYNETRGGWKSLNYLIDQHICTGPQDFFSTIRPQIGYDMPSFMPVNEAINLIRHAGGIPVLAHPGASISAELLETYLERILEAGIAGVECYAQYHDQETTTRCVNWCKKHHALMTGGSDYHGGFVNRRLGFPIVDSDSDLRLGPILAKAVYK